MEQRTQNTNRSKPQASSVRTSGKPARSSTAGSSRAAKRRTTANAVDARPGSQRRSAQVERRPQKLGSRSAKNKAATSDDRLVKMPASQGPLAVPSREVLEPPSELEAEVAFDIDSLREGVLLNAEQELLMAKEIEQLEVEHWKTLLSHPALVSCVRECAEAAVAPKELLELVVTETKGASHARKVSARKRAATTSTRDEESTNMAALALRAFDEDRSLLRAADLSASSLRHAADGELAAAFARIDRARRTHQRAKNRFVTANLRLVVAMARRYDRGLLPLADLVQEGNLGLMRAVERFDYRRGFRFSTYASWWIRHGFNRAISDKGRLVRVPVHTLDEAQRVARTAEALAQKTGRVPRLDELAEATGVSEDKLTFLREHASARPPVWLDKKVTHDTDATLLDVLTSPDAASAEESVDEAELPGRLAGVMHVLSPLEADIVRLRFGLENHDELTLREVGEKYSLSRERIRQLQEQALLKLRAELERGSGSAEGGDAGTRARDSRAA